MSAHHVHSGKHEAHGRLIARLRQQAGDVEHITAGLDEASLAKRTIPDKWSLHELVCHLQRMQEVFEGRIDAVLAEDNPAIVSYSPEGDAEFDKLVSQAPKTAITAFQESRERLAGRLEGLSPSEWHRPGRHPDFPHYDVHFQIEYMIHHEGHHIYQMYQRRVPFGKLPH